MVFVVKNSNGKMDADDNTKYYFENLELNADNILIASIRNEKFTHFEIVIHEPRIIVSVICCSNKLMRFWSLQICLNKCEIIL